MRRLLGSFILAGALVCPALAQENSPFGGFKHDRNEPVEITSDELEVRQAEEVAIFKGNVVAGQGTLRLTAREMIVSFDQDKQDSDSETGAITKVEAKGDVFLSNGAETAQGAFAEYNLETGMVKMTGDVVLTQGGNAGKGQSLTINLNTGVARFAGRPKLVLRPGSAKPEPKPAPCEDAALAATARQLGVAERYELVCVRKSSTN